MNLLFPITKIKTVNNFKSPLKKIKKRVLQLISNFNTLTKFTSESVLQGLCYLFPDTLLINNCGDLVTGIVKLNY